MSNRSSRPTSDLLLRLWGAITPRRRSQLLGLVLLVAASAVAEVASLGMAIPFIAALMNPSRILDHDLARPLLHILQIDHPDALLLPLTFLFCFLAALSALVRFSLTWAQVRLAERIGNDLGEEAFQRTLSQPYPVHVMRNSSEVLAALMSKTDTVIHFVLIPLLMLAGAALTGAAIVAFMIWASPSVTLFAFLTLGGAYGGMAAFNRQRMAEESRRVAAGQTRVAQIVQEGLGGIRDVLLSNLQPYFVGRFREADRSLRQAIGSITILGTAPRSVVEALAVIVVGSVVVYAARTPAGLDAAIPTLGALALALQRLLPMAQQAYYSATAVQGGRTSLEEVLALLDQPMPDRSAEDPSTEFQFERALEFCDVAFRYNEAGPMLLRRVTLSIPKGSRVGIIGATGSGKSTFLDLAMGLLVPTSGHVLVDGVPLGERNVRHWQARIAHVPQQVFLLDGSVAENIAFGENLAQIDMDRLREAARAAQLERTILGWPEGFDTRVGERGMQLSGGQRQRIGVARALYRRAELLVLDEATSALDDATEDSLVEALEQLGRSLTVLTVAHRQRSLRNCDVTIEISSDGLVRCVTGTTHNG